MLTGIKKLLGIISILALTLTLLYTAEVPSVQAASPDSTYELTADNSTAIVTGCIFSAIFDAITAIQQDTTTVAMLTTIFGMVIDIIICADAEGEYTVVACIFDSILEMVSEISVCGDNVCLISSIFDMIIDLITCTEPLEAATA